jgi:methyltransferase (TIGR00027 family)
MAFYRALESVRPGGQRLFNDPFAIHFLGPALRSWVAMSRIPYLATALAWYADLRAPGARTSAIARTRLVDDTIAEALGCGMRQVVILGAGFDCRIYRLACLDAVAAFEVDHPATLALKLSRLRRVDPRLPATTRFVEIDFQQQSLAETLQQAGFNSRQPAIFLWEGVTNYLTADAVDRVLRYVASCAARSLLIFTYVHRRALDGSGEFPDAAAITHNVAKLGEPWTFGLIPETLSSYLDERGLRLDRDLGARQYRAEYFGRAAEAMQG